jgi:hypothetical protein
MSYVLFYESADDMLSKAPLQFKELGPLPTMTGAR